MRTPLDAQPLGICCKRGTDWLDFFAAIDGQGFEHVELNIPSVSPDAQIFDFAYLDGVRALIEAAGVGVSLHGAGGTNLAEKVDRIRAVSLDIVCEGIAAAERLGGRWVTLHLGSAGIPNSAPERKRRRLEVVYTSIARLLDRTPDSNVILGLENLPRLGPEKGLSRLGDCADEFEYLLDRLGSERVGVVFDVGHARIGRTPAAVQDFIRRVGSRIVGFHLHWNDGLEDLHAPLVVEGAAELRTCFEAIATHVRQTAPVLLESYSVEDNLTSAAVLAQL